MQGKGDQKAGEDIDAQIQNSYLELVPSSITPVPAVRHGKAHEAILHYAGEINADLIVIGRHGSRGLSRAFFGNVTE